jgi:hypothetical protein
MNSKNFLATILKVIFMVMRRELSGECKFIVYGFSPACRQAKNDKLKNVGFFQFSVVVHCYFCFSKK